MSLFKNKHNFSELNFKKDFHSHLLPGVDDGIQTLEDSIAILENMVTVGIEELVLTPHICNELFPENSESVLKEKYKSYIDSLPIHLKEKIKISLGAEYMVEDGFEKRNPDELLQFDNNSILIEMSYFFISKNIEEAIFNISSSGYHPVIAHPERYLYLSRSLDSFERYFDMGATYQMNLLSLSGIYGRESMRILKYVASNGWYSHYGTDTHSVPHFKRVSEMKYQQTLVIIKK